MINLQNAIEQTVGNSILKPSHGLYVRYLQTRDNESLSIAKEIFH